MKDQILSLLRHAVTGLAALGTLLATKSLIAPEDVAVVNDSGASLGSAVVVIVGAILARLALTGLGKLFPKTDGEHTSNGGSGGRLPLWMLVGTAAALMTTLPSCSMPEGYNLSGSAYLTDGDDKAGLKFEGGNVLPFGRFAIRDPQTGKVTGYAAVQAAPKVRATK